MHMLSNAGPERAFSSQNSPSGADANAPRKNLPNMRDGAGGVKLRISGFCAGHGS